MTAKEIVEYLLDKDEMPAALTEASVHLPPRSHVWVASFQGPEPGKQVCRSTGTTDRLQALLLARKWEAEARRQRAAWRGPRKPTIRNQPSSGGGFTQKEVARLLDMSERGVREVERRAFAKLRKHPMLRELWRQYLTGDIDERGQAPLTVEEVNALLAVARTPEELAVMRKVLGLIQR